MSESPVFLFDNSDPEMQAAYERARATFRYFWREMAWERRRIVPALTLGAVKAPFSDGPDAERDDDNPGVEHMWMNDVDFDGRTVSGTLLNQPNWIKSVSAGDSVEVPLSHISDWMYAIGEDVYGAHSVNLLRSRMNPRERKEHDAAWGLNFGDPQKVRIVPQEKKSGGFLKSLFGGKSNEAVDGPIGEHPMSINMAEVLPNELKENPELLNSADEKGWTVLHVEALAGSAPTVKVLLEHGADRNARTADGRTPLQLAQSLGWEDVIALLSRKKA